MAFGRYDRADRGCLGLADRVPLAGSGLAAHGAGGSGAEPDLQPNGTHRETDIPRDSDILVRSRAIRGYPIRVVADIGAL